jgi:hypothetical protein
VLTHDRSRRASMCCMIIAMRLHGVYLLARQGLRAPAADLLELPALYLRPCCMALVACGFLRRPHSCLLLLPPSCVAHATMNITSVEKKLAVAFAASAAKVCVASIHNSTLISVP